MSLMMQSGKGGMPMTFHYFDMHGRGLGCRMVLHYLKGCRWADAPMTQPEFAQAKASGKIKYAQMPVLNMPDGKTQLYQSNAIVRFLAKTHVGLCGETLYPPNSMPQAMQAVDEILELSADFKSSYGPFTLPFLPGYKTRLEQGQPEWLNEKFPKFAQRMCDIKKARGHHSCYLATEGISIADIVMYADFWKLAFNPAAD